MYRKRRLRVEFLILFLILLLITLGILFSLRVVSGLKRMRLDYALPGFVCFGDSLTAGFIADAPSSPYTDTLEELIDTNVADTEVINYGASGEDSATIIARGGGMDFCVSENIVIPAGVEGVELELGSKDGRRLFPLLYNEAGFNPCSIAGVEGELKIKEAGNKKSTYIFTRSEPGTSINVSAGERLIPHSAGSYMDHIPIIFVGTNGGFKDFEDLVRQEDLLIKYRTAHTNGKYLVVGMYNGNEWLDEYDRIMYEHYKEHYLSLRSYLAYYGMEKAGLLEKEEDIYSYKTRKVPPSLLSDSVHLTDVGYRVLGEIIYEKLDDLGYFDEIRKRDPADMAFDRLSGEREKTRKFAEGLPNGINIGNSLDCYIEEDTGNKPNDLEYEILWGNPYISETYIDKLYEEGVRCVRIPVTWDEHLDDFNNINPAWLARVKQVVDLAFNKEMYVILDMHHDKILYTGYEGLDENVYLIKKIWSQIAAQFKNYDEHLIFEGLNEPRLFGTDEEWKEGTDESIFCLSKMNREFIDAVRNVGGMNEDRYLIIGGYRTGHTGKILSDMIIPDDGRLIMAVHAYVPYEFTQHREGGWSASDKNDTTEIEELVGNITSFTERTGMKVMITEFGCVNKGGNEKERLDWCRYYLDRINSIGVKCLWWDNGKKSGPDAYSIIDRNTGEITDTGVFDMLFR